MTSARDDVPADVVRTGLRVLWSGARQEPWVAALSVAAAALWGGGLVASSVALGWAVDRAVVPAAEQGRVDVAVVVTGALALLAVAVARGFGVVGRRVGSGVVMYRLQARYRRDVTRQYLRLPLAWHQRHPTGQLLSNANADVEATWRPVAPAPMAFGVLVMLAVASVALLLTDVVLAAVALLVVPALLVVNVVYTRRLSPLAARAQQLRAEVSEVAHESFDGALTVRAAGRGAEETRRFGVRADELRDALVRVGRVRAVFDPVVEALPSLGVLVVLLVGTDRLADGALDVEELVRVAYLFTLIAFPVRALGWVLGEIPGSVVGWTRVRSVLDAEGHMAWGATALPAGSAAAALAADGLRHAYERPDGTPGPDVLVGAALDVQPGRLVAVVGPTGAGKTTLVDLLLRLVDPADGAVRLDDVDVRDLADGQLPAAAAYVGQDVFVFDDTVRGNVTLGLEVDDDEVWDALRRAGADGVVAALPDGLDTRVGERGATLSGGQRQRLAIARALVRRPRLLVLDDATSAVDPAVEQQVLRGLRDAASPATVVVVAYRRSTIALADEVVWVDGGRVAARGSMERLQAEVPGFDALLRAYDRDGGDAAGRTSPREVPAGQA